MPGCKNTCNKNDSSDNGQILVFVNRHQTATDPVFLNMKEGIARGASPHLKTDRIRRAQPNTLRRQNRCNVRIKKPSQIFASVRCQKSNSSPVSTRTTYKRLESARTRCLNDFFNSCSSLWSLSLPCSPECPSNTSTRSATAENCSNQQSLACSFSRPHPSSIAQWFSDIWRKEIMKNWRRCSKHAARDPKALSRWKV